MRTWTRIWATSCIGAVALLSLACGDRRGDVEPEASVAPTASVAPVPTAAASTPGPANPPPTVVHGAPVRERVLLSPVYEVDRLYPSMTGPNSTETVKLGEQSDAAPELVWVVGFEATMVAADGATPASQEFMCHTNLDVDPIDHRARFGEKKPITGRLFTLSQGQYRIDMPLGFGIPVQSDESILVNTQVLNLNEEGGAPPVRHRVSLRYVRDAELARPLTPLYVAGAYGLKLLEGEDGHYGLDPAATGATSGDALHRAGTAPASSAAAGKDPPSMDTQHTACLPGTNAGTNAFDDGRGRSFTGHWVVPPGREVNHTRVTDLMALPFDTTLHYVAVHLHPFAETLELKDLTTGNTVYRAKARQADRGVGLAHVDFFSSQEGIPLYRDHEYEIVSVYNNTSGVPQDSMAVMNLYLRDMEFRAPGVRAGDGAPSPSPSASGPAPRPQMMGAR
ncbi:MAG: hypothetical protein AAF928_19870 [Myxococcota bacterium]